MKSKYFLVGISVSFLLGCSTKKDTFLARNSHALSTKYNILYNGQLELDKGLKEINENVVENFWNRLSVEKMKPSDEQVVEENSKNSNFQNAEARATKAIQKHSMNIGGQEKNYQIDEAYLLLGKARYYDQRFIPALDAFNYILYKYPNSSNIFTAKIWREKTNVRLGNDQLAIKNTNKLIKDNNLKNQEFANANAILASAFLNIEQKDSAIVKLKMADKYTKINSDKERYSYILGQLYEEEGKKDSAIYFYQKVIDMNRKAQRKFVIQAYAQKAKLNNYQGADYDEFVKRSTKIMQDRENRPYLDVIYHSIGIFYDNNNQKEKALEFYNASLESKSADAYLNASNHRNIGNLYFKNTDYTLAAKSYDKSLELLNPKSREFYQISKIRKNLNEAIINEAIAKRNDSIIYVVSLSEAERLVYYENHIQRLKSSDELKKLFEERQKKIQGNIALNTATNMPMDAIQGPNGQPTKSASLAATTKLPNPNGAVFYFYNPNTVAFGKLEFQKLWGGRAQTGYWRVSALNVPDASLAKADVNPLEQSNELADAAPPNEKYATDYYLKQLPATQHLIDSIIKERNEVYYALGVIYKEKFKEYDLATNRLEKLLSFKPEEKLIPPTKYHLFKIYEKTNAEKANVLKNEIVGQYPNSRYTQIIQHSKIEEQRTVDSPEGEYEKMYRWFQNENFGLVMKQIDPMIEHFLGEPIVAKFELLKANTIGKLKGLKAYKAAMEYVADNYSNSPEGKEAQEILRTQIPQLEKLAFSELDSKNWKVVYRIDKNDLSAEAAIEKKLRLFLESENVEKLSYSCDPYTETERLICITGIRTKTYAQFVAALFAENKKYIITQPGIVISNENYSLVQMKKNLDEFLLLKKP